MCSARVSDRYPIGPRLVEARSEAVGRRRGVSRETQKNHAPHHFKIVGRESPVSRSQSIFFRPGVRYATLSQFALLFRCPLAVQATLPPL